MNNRKSIMWATVMAGLVFVTVGSLVLQNSPKQSINQTSKFQFVSAKTNITKDAVIKEEDVEIKDFPMNVENAYKATGEVVGRNASKDITAGKVIIKNFIKEIVIKDDSPQGEEPQGGFRAVPILVKKSSLPPYIAIGAKFDLFTKENSMRIENLKILNILSPAKDDANKMLLVEIKNSDVEKFIKNQVETKGFVFIQKNKSEYGDYKFYDTKPQISANPIRQNEPAVMSDVELIPKIEDINIKTFNNEINNHTNAVEVIVGSTKSKVEFE